MSFALRKLRYDRHQLDAHQHLGADQAIVADVREAQLDLV